MEVIKFRNHFSVVFERIGALLVVLVMIVFQNIENLGKGVVKLETIKNHGISAGDLFMALGVTLGVLVLGGVIVLYHVWVWSRTWITITGSTIVMEQNTFNQTKNTIGFKNISNVNIDQNIWEKVLGTCKVKLDTSSLSTANTTDVKIVLKRKKAMEVQNLILQRVNAAQGQANQKIIEEDKKNLNKFDFISKPKDIFLHGICSINIFTILLLVSCIGGSAAAFANFGDSVTKNLTTVLANAIVILGVIVACIRGLASGFVTYHEFRVGRRGNKIYVHYGLLRTIDYTIPVSQINGVIIHQTLIGRILKKYMVELINVGMGDEKAEAGSYIILACGKEELQKQLQMLLPEYASVPIERIRRQPKEVWWNKLIKLTAATCIFVAAGIILLRSIPELPAWTVVLSVSVLIAFGCILSLLDFLTAGSYFDDTGILVANGYFRRDICLMPYRNVQYLRLRTNIVLNHFGLVKGNSFLLAVLANQAQSLPVCSSEKLEKHLQKSYYHMV